jgi:hypothetical protein
MVQVVDKSAEGNAGFPRLLLGAAVIFWGWMVDLPVVGLILAFVLEGPLWIKGRWDFGETAYVRAWSISVVAMLLTAFVLWMNGIEPETVRAFVSWMPLFLVSVQWTQVYGTESTLPLHTFSYFSRKKVALERELGMDPEVPKIAFTPVYFVACLVFAAAGKNAYDAFFFTGLLVLMGWCLWSVAGKRLSNRWFFCLAFLVMAALAVAMQWGLLRAHQMLMGRGAGGDSRASQRAQWHRSNTNIGQVGQIKLSSEIFWRVSKEAGVAPDLLMTASYNRYFPSGHWRYEPPGDVTQEFDFTGLAAVGRTDRGADAAEDEKLYRTTGEIAIGDENREDLPRFRLIGAAETDSLVPLPGSLFSYYVNVQELESNSVGTVRMTPRHGVVEGVVRWDGGFDRDGEPFPEESPGEGSADQSVPTQERELLEQVVTDLRLREMPIDEKIATLKLWFYRHFRYTTYLTIHDQLREKWRREEQNRRFRTMSGRDSALAQFLLEEKAGHCEYFATATTLLLRAAGEKARYVVGFSVQEKHPKTGEYLLRGTHAHAWCRVWNEQTGRWINVDTTPPTWVGVEVGSTGWRRTFLDQMQRVRENFTIWRTQPENQVWVMSVFVVLGGGVLLWIAWRLWQTRARVGADEVKELRPLRDNPWGEWEQVLVKKIGVRPLGMSYAQWLLRLAPEVGDETIRQMISLHNRWRYDPAPVEAGEGERLRRMMAMVLRRAD